MRKIMKLFLPLTLILVGQSCNEPSEPSSPHIVFIMGDEEYRSEESMPMLASILERELGARTSLCFSVDSLGYIDPNRSDYIEGLEALADADLMVMFTRFRVLPGAQLQLIKDYVESGRPIVGFRTSTHAFLYKEDSSLMYMNNEWPTKVFGQQWITHHGHFDDGEQRLTSVYKVDEVDHEILNGFMPFDAYSWLYHVDGGDWKLYGDSKPLLMGKSLKSNHKMNNRLDQFPMVNPIAWTKSYSGESGNTSRVFFTTLGHPYDFKEESMRKLALNGIYWALNIPIPKQGVNAEMASPYHPNNSGFGMKYKQGIKPERLMIND
jgi:type 1 glutamine amidotransferase